MTPVDQQHFSDPAQGSWGDCTRACIASVLDLPIEQVPHFLALALGDAEDYWNRIYDFLEDRGLVLHPDAAPDDARMAHALYVLGSGPSPRGAGLFHHVVMHGREIAHDPHPSRAGLLGSYNDWRFDLIFREGACA